jgi:hypothetical protein
MAVLVYKGYAQVMPLARPGSEANTQPKTAILATHAVMTVGCNLLSLGCAALMTALQQRRAAVGFRTARTQCQGATPGEACVLGEGCPLCNCAPLVSSVRRLVVPVAEVRVLGITTHSDSHRPLRMGCNVAHDSARSDTMCEWSNWMAVRNTVTHVVHGTDQDGTALTLVRKSRR